MSIFLVSDYNVCITKGWIEIQIASFKRASSGEDKAFHSDRLKDKYIFKAWSAITPWSTNNDAAQSNYEYN
jgi:hypothetical protein